jgi:hypothetical protein
MKCSVLKILSQTSITNSQDKEEPSRREVGEVMLIVLAKNNHLLKKFSRVLEKKNWHNNIQLKFKP